MREIIFYFEMGTMCYVAVRRPGREELLFILCKVDGYPEHMLPVLRSRFPGEEEAQ